MTDITNRVPPEIWINVFHQMWGSGELCQCRLVCRQWSQLAEIVMLSKKLYVYDGGLPKLSAYLREKPEKARLIKHLEMISSSDNPTAYIDLVKAAFTDNLEYLSTGSWKASDAFYAALLNTAKRFLPTTEHKLKVMPNPAQDHSNNFIEALLTFKDSIQQLHIFMECIHQKPALNNLSVFKQLENLTLTAKMLIHMKGLDAVLRHCPLLRNLKLDYPYNFEETIDSVPFTIQWTADSVEKVRSLQKVRIDQPHLDLVLYLTYKYPNIKQFVSGGMTRVFYQQPVSGQLLDAIKHIPEINVGFKIVEYQDVRSAIPAICGYRDMSAKMSARICYGMVFKDEVGFKGFVNFHHNNSRKRQELVIGVHGSAPSSVQLGILDELSAMSDHCTIEHLCLDSLRYRWWNPGPGQQLVSLYHVFEALPKLKTLSILVERLEYKAIKAGSHMKGELEELDIDHAAIDMDMFPHISLLYPNLYHLHLRDCSMINANGENQVDVYSINMPHSSLAFLSLEISNMFYNDVDHHEAILNVLASDRPRYLQVSLLSLDMNMYCKLEEKRSVTTFITQQELELERKPVVLFSVTCENVARIHLEIFKEECQVDVDAYVSQQLQSLLEELQLELETKDQNNSAERQGLNQRLAGMKQKYEMYLAASACYKSKLDEYGLFIKGEDSFNYFFARSRFFY